MNELKKWLTINSIFSFTSGTLMIILNQYLQNIFGTNLNFLFPLIGLNLLVFAGFVFFISKYYLQNKTWTYVICFLDLIWVLGTAVLFIINPSSMLQIAYLISGLVAFIVGFMAIMQYKSASKF